MYCLCGLEFETSPVRFEATEFDDWTAFANTLTLKTEKYHHCQLCNKEQMLPSNLHHGLLKFLQWKNFEIIVGLKKIKTLKNQNEVEITLPLFFIRFIFVQN